GMGHERVAVRLRIAVGIACEHDLGTHVAHRIDLDLRRCLRHHDHGTKSELTGGERDALRMVAGARGDDAAAALLWCEVGDLVVCPPEFEAEDRLKIFALEQHGVAKAAREPWRWIQWRFARDVVDAAGENVVEKSGERWVQLDKSNGRGQGTGDRG